MQIKIDFVTTSSSESFFIMLDSIHDKQVLMINNPFEISSAIHTDGENIYNTPNQAWRITQDHEKISGDTSMDNFDMMWFLDEIGIKRDYIHYDHS